MGQKKKNNNKKYLGKIWANLNFRDWKLSIFVRFRPLVHNPKKYLFHFESWSVKRLAIQWVMHLTLAQENTHYIYFRCWWVLARKSVLSSFRFAFMRKIIELYGLVVKCNISSKTWLTAVAFSRSLSFAMTLCVARSQGSVIN